MRGATKSLRHRGNLLLYFNPRTPCGVRLLPGRAAHRAVNFNPRTPCGVRLSIIEVLPTLVGFQSTHPLRGATDDKPNERDASDISIHAPHAGCDGRALPPARQDHDFNPRTPCGVRPRHVANIIKRWEISIHAPHAGCDLLGKVAMGNAKHFNPRTPCGVRRGAETSRKRTRDFNPRTPCGVRPVPVTSVKSYVPFQSTHPMRGATRRT